MPSKTGSTQRHTTKRAVAHRAADLKTASAHRGADDLKARLTRALTLVNQAIAELSTVEPLTDEQRKHVARPKAGAGRYLAALAEMPAEFTELASLADIAPGITVDTDIGDTADRFVIKCDRLRQLVADLALEHHGEAWIAGMDIYAAAEIVERRNSAIGTALAPVRGFLAHAGAAAGGSAATGDAAAPTAPAAANR